MSEHNRDAAADAAREHEQPPTASPESSHDYVAWINKLIKDSGEFAYRYVYDAYLVARDQDTGLFFRADVTAAGESTATRICHRVRRDVDVDLTLSSDAERRAFVAYLEMRFAPGRSMDAWHEQEHRDFLEDRWWLD